MLLNNRYLLQNTIVQNPTSITYLGNDTHTNQDVSIIVLQENHRTDQRFVRVFQKEAMSLYALHRISNYGQCDGKYFLVIEDTHITETVSEMLTRNLH